MKNLILFSFILSVCLELASCKKDNSLTIVGKWNVINDSTTSGIGPNILQQNYIGVPGDYFDFRTDGNVYIKEGVSLDTLAYTVYSGNKISITSFGWTGIMSDILNLSPHNATIHAPNLINPGGYYERTLNLSR